MDESNSIPNFKISCDIIIFSSFCHSKFLCLYFELNYREMPLVPWLFMFQPIRNKLMKQNKCNHWINKLWYIQWRRKWQPIPVLLPGKSHGQQHARPLCPSPTPRAYSDSCPLMWWCHPTISSSVLPFSCFQSFPASGSFLMSQLFPSGFQNIGASASVLPMNIQDWFSFRIDWLDLLAVKGTLRSLLQHHSSKASIPLCSAAFMVAGLIM